MPKPGNFWRLIPVVAAFGGGAAVLQAGQDATADRRHAMVQEVKDIAAMVAELTRRPELDARVLDVMREVPRHEFVPADQRRSAYANRPLAIGHGQTISQPFIVALMTDLLDVAPSDTVLEVGTGSGYQAAILSKLARKVYSIELNPELGASARATLQRLGYANVETEIGDGWQGWREHAPFDAIMVTAAPEQVPEQLVEQLKPGGRMVIPVGRMNQDLRLITKLADGTTTTASTVPVRFVPMLGGSRKENN